MRIDRREFLTATGTTAVAGAFAGCINTSRKPAEATPMTVTGKSSDLCFMSARELATLIRSHKLSARELMAAYLGQMVFAFSIEHRENPAQRNSS